MKETFGQRLSRLRRAKGLTQDDVAKQITISPQAISKWENDISSPDIEELSTLADILGVSVNVLLGKEDITKEVADEVVDEAPKFKENNDEPWGHGYKSEDDFDKEVRSQRKKMTKFDIVRLIVDSSLMALALLGYILLGVFWKDQTMGWRTGWVLFLVAIVIGSIFNVIKEKKITNFAYPVLVVGVYVTLGIFGDHFGFNGWHPYWFLFITIPVFYLIFGSIDKVIHQNDEPKKEKDD